MSYLTQSAHTNTGGCLLAAALALSAGCVARSPSPVVSVEHRQLLLLLEQEMNSNTGWVRIHAAEALIGHRHAQPVAPSFVPEADTAAPPYRIGVWRVLARAATTEGQRQAFVERIHRTMLDPQAPDRVHAAESLAKLGATSPGDSPVLVEWLAAASEAVSVYPLWLLVLSGSNFGLTGSEARLSDLLDAKDATARLRAAFALGRIKTVSSAAIARLSRRLNLEPADSPVRGYIAAALLRHTTRDSSGAARLKQVLGECLVRGQPAEQLEAAITLGLCGTPEDLPVLAPLLQCPEADARIGAASGSLYILEARGSRASR